MKQLAIVHTSRQFIRNLKVNSSDKSLRTYIKFMSFYWKYPDNILMLIEFLPVPMRLKSRISENFQKIILIQRNLQFDPFSKSHP